MIALINADQLSLSGWTKLYFPQIFGNTLIQLLHPHGTSLVQDNQLGFRGLKIVDLSSQHI